MNNFDAERKIEDYAKHIAPLSKEEIENLDFSRYDQSPTKNGFQERLKFLKERDISTKNLSANKES
jgi:hypothetical protein